MLRNNSRAVLSKFHMKVFLVMFLAALTVGTSQGQTAKQYKKSTVRAKPVKTPIKVRTVSLGVVNGRAIDLVQPKYPPAALAVNAYGQVPVSVIIDENGVVLSARVLKGHPLLRATAVAAALRSRFAPYTVGESAARVNGVIDYHFLPNQWNWLEIGYSLGGGNAYYTIPRLREQFPIGFGDVTALLRESGANWEGTVDSAVALTKGKLVDDPRSAWLFEIGLTLGEMKSICCRVDDELRETSHHIKNQLEIVPPRTSADLLAKLRRISFLVDNSDVQKYDPVLGSPLYQHLSGMEDRFPMIGR